jgi:hypothetical protein
MSAHHDVNNRFRVMSSTWLAASASSKRRRYQHARDAPQHLALLGEERHDRYDQEHDNDRNGFVTYGRLPPVIAFRLCDSSHVSHHEFPPIFLLFLI